MPFLAVKVPNGANNASEVVGGGGTCTRQCTGLLGLPLDTIIQVLSFILPMDILSVRKTCKQLMLASCQRIVWINAIRLVCAQRGIFTRSFPVKEMSLAQLEHAATSPFRFTNIIRKSTGSTTAQPVAIRLLQPRLPKDMSGENGVFDSSYLVPGGRFLLTRSSRNLLQLWDLGYSADMMIKPESIASHHLGEGELQFDPDAQVTQDGQGLLVFLASENVFRIFEVYPLSPSPTFKKVASIDVVLGGRCVYVFTNKTIIYYMNRRLTVWDYMADTIATWTIRSARVWDIAVSNSHITLLDQTGFSVHKIPPLRPRNTSEPNPSSQPLSNPSMQAPLATVTYPITSVLKVADNWSWYTSVNDTRPIHFDVIGIGSAPRTPHNSGSSAASSSYIFSLNNPTYDDPDAVDSDSEDGGTSSQDALIVARYTLRKVNNDPKDGLPEYMPVLLEHVRLGGYLQPLVDNARSIRTGSRDLVLMWPSQHGRLLHVYYSDLENHIPHDFDEDTTSPSSVPHSTAPEDLPAPPRTRPRPKIASLEISGSFTGEVICCPFSGRVCCVDESGVAHIIDYVRPVGS
ncbi:hypothetical protein ONZ45_g5916 [Pleurotus djamor]|nr:hypothetical protein ONZ45_g5916 [Pleurotus djamor]